MFHKSAKSQIHTVSSSRTQRINASWHVARTALESELRDIRRRLAALEEELSGNVIPIRPANEKRCA